MSKPCGVPFRMRAAPLAIETLAARIADLVVERLRDEQSIGLSVKKFAERIGHSPSFVHREIKAGRLHATQLGGRGERIVSREAAAAWMAGTRT